MGRNNKASKYDKSLYNSSLYRSWYNMKTRCTNKNSPNYEAYGKRGITFNTQWVTFEGFLKDMYFSYKEGLTLDRIDNNGNYCKENCRWATHKEQANNTRNIERASKYEISGVEYTIKQLSEMFGIKRTTLDMRLRQYNWSLNRALNYKLQ